MTAKPGFHVCYSCEPPTLVPNDWFLPHLMEHIDSLAVVASAALTEADAEDGQP